MTNYSVGGFFYALAKMRFGCGYFVVTISTWGGPYMPIGDSAGEYLNMTFTKICGIPHRLCATEHILQHSVCCMSRAVSGKVCALKISQRTLGRDSF